MSFKIIKKRKIPLVIRQYQNTIYCQSQYEVVGVGKKILGVCVDFFQMESTLSLKEIGENILKLLDKFQSYGDMTPRDVFVLKKVKWDEYEKLQTEEIWNYFHVKNDKEMLSKYKECGITYYMEEKKYKLDFAWYNSRKKQLDFATSIGREDLLLFDTPLEFDSTITPEELGCMVLEAFDRCERLTELANSTPFPRKELTLLDDSKLEVQMPKDKHFSDSEDMGVGEIYQAYEYFPREDSDVAAIFSLGIGVEYNCDISEEGIRKGWEKYHSKADFFEVQEVSHGIYALRAEMRDKATHKISYFLMQEENLILECTMEVFQPGKRKKMDEKLSALFEEFALSCKFKR